MSWVETSEQWGHHGMLTGDIVGNLEVDPSSVESCNVRRKIGQVASLPTVSSFDWLVGFVPLASFYMSIEQGRCNEYIKYQSVSISQTTLIIYFSALTCD